LTTKGTPIFRIRLRKSLSFELEALARKRHLSLAEYARHVLVKHLEEQAENMGVGHPDLSPFDRAVKEYILAYRQGVLVAGLPGKARRGDLEGLAWQSLEEALKYAKTQDKPLLRLLAMRVVTALMRVELAILHEQDAAHVDELVEDLEARRGELETQTKASEDRRVKKP
jgi:hypothetical protein